MTRDFNDCGTLIEAARTMAGPDATPEQIGAVYRRLVARVRVVWHAGQPARNEVIRTGEALIVNQGYFAGQVRKVVQQAHDEAVADLHGSISAQAQWIGVIEPSIDPAEAATKAVNRSRKRNRSK